jgi:hypothetical protein
LIPSERREPVRPFETIAEQRRKLGRLQKLELFSALWLFAGAALAFSLPERQPLGASLFLMAVAAMVGFMIARTRAKLQQLDQLEERERELAKWTSSV